MSNNLITKTPGVCGGDACVHGTRIPVWILVEYRRLGATDADLQEMYPHLTSEEVVGAFEYAAVYPDEIDLAIRANAVEEQVQHLEEAKRVRPETMQVVIDV